MKVPNWLIGKNLLILIDRDSRNLDNPLKLINSSQWANLALSLVAHQYRFWKVIKIPFKQAQTEKSTIILSDFMTNLIKLFYVYMEKYLFWNFGGVQIRLRAMVSWAKFLRITYRLHFCYTLYQKKNWPGLIFMYKYIYQMNWK